VTLELSESSQFNWKYHFKWAVSESQKLEQIKQLIRFEGSTLNDLPHVAGRRVLESIAGLTMEKRTTAA